MVDKLGNTSYFLIEHSVALADYTLADTNDILMDFNVESFDCDMII